MADTCPVVTTATVPARSARAHARAPAPSPPTCRDRAPGAGARATAIHLARGNLLRIRDGRGTLLTASAGVLWITEERSPVDTVLLPGDTWRIGNDGTTLAQAHRSARVVLEVPGGLPAPRRVEMAPADGERGFPIALGKPGPCSPGAFAAAMVATIGRVSAAIDALWTRHGPSISTGGWIGHDRVYSTRCRHAAGQGGAPPWREDRAWRARDAASRVHAFPHR